MQARGPLMIEHRLIERMLSVIKNVLGKIESENEVDPIFVDIAVDFIRIYADRTHHGKEEDILFRELNKKTLTSEDSQIMKELTEEHVFGRQTTKALIEANNRYRKGDFSSSQVWGEPGIAIINIFNPPDRLLIADCPQVPLCGR
jgi:hemerythrin-like domain-containing protein